MSNTTTNYNFVKPEEDDFYDIGEYNATLDSLDEALADMEERKLEKDGDVSGAAVGSLEAAAAEFPVPGEGEILRSFLGKVRKFIQDFNNFKAGVITLGKLANNGVTTASGFALDARYGKTLYDLCNQLNGNINSFSSLNWSVLAEDADNVGSSRTWKANGYDPDTLNTPYKENLTGPLAAGGMMTYMSSESNGQQLSLVAGNLHSGMFIRARNANTGWQPWHKVLTSKDFVLKRSKITKTIPANTLVEICHYTAENDQLVTVSGWMVTDGNFSGARQVRLQAGSLAVYMNSIPAGQNIIGFSTSVFLAQGQKLDVIGYQASGTALSTDVYTTSNVTFVAS